MCVNFYTCSCRVFCYLFHMRYVCELRCAYAWPLFSHFGPLLHPCQLHPAPAVVDDVIPITYPIIGGNWSVQTARGLTMAMHACISYIWYAWLSCEWADAKVYVITACTPSFFFFSDLSGFCIFHQGDTSSTYVHIATQYVSMGTAWQWSY